ncbi:PadR family transcriptional regulator [Aquihabitans sp. McL0605]|uniref:PadR family transcriptional regulator n=1 Tax=Aquihabitans sp. McL0605 TaxID=3415671 RepID=UPI003CECCB93
MKNHNENRTFEHDNRGRRAAHDDVTDAFGRFGGPPFRGRGGRGGPFDRPRGRGGRGGGRARRGDVRAALLALLAEKPMHGYEMIQELDERTGGAWKPSPGSVYPTLTMLEEEGLITAEEIEGKRRFTLTDGGREAVAGREGPAPWEQVVTDADPAVFELRDVLGSTMSAVKQVFRVGTPAQQTKAVEILTDTRRRLYEVLASEED